MVATWPPAALTGRPVATVCGMAEVRVSPRANGVAKPVLGAVNGVCTGVGMQIVASCDGLIVSEDAG